MVDKILFTATVDSHIKHFHLPYLKWFKEQGFEVHVASRGESKIPFADVKYEIPFERSPFKFSNIKAYKQLKEIIEKNDYLLIHCHTPVGGVLTRLAARKARKSGTKVIYTAHGFHFYKGAPLKNWLIYYPIEKWLARYTDCLITINEEDYALAKNEKFKAGRIEKVNGVGVDLSKFAPQEEDVKRKLRLEYGFNIEDFVLIFVGELSYRKHQDLLIDAVALLKERIPNIKLLLVGKGEMEYLYKKKVEKLGLKNEVEFLGYRNDVPNLMAIADVVLSSARHEGLPVNVMEAMATGLPLVVTDCRGNRDLVQNGENGFVVGINDAEGMAERMEYIYNNGEMKEKARKYNLNSIRNYSLDTIEKQIACIYNEMLKN